MERTTVMDNTQFGDDWVTAGWGREPNTRKWQEYGASKGITIDPPPLPPELGIHDVAEALNTRDAQIQVLIEQCSKLLGLFADVSKAFLHLRGRL